MAWTDRRRERFSGRSNARMLTLLALLVLSAISYSYKHWHHDPTLTTTIGTPRIVDGDTLEISGKRIRLESIDAPELHQTCQDAKGREWSCGSTAARELRSLINGRNVRCEPSRFDQYRRMLAICFLPDNTDLNAWMVRQGWAVAFRNSNRYRAQQREAENAKRGLWAGSFTLPWEWRDHHGG